MSRTLRMSFKTADDDSWNLSVRYPKTDITAGEVQTVMQALIDHPVFLAGVTAILGAEVVEQTITDLI